MYGLHALSRRATRLLWAVAAVATLATSAFAQDYTVTSVTGQYVTPPSSGTTDVLPNITNKDDGVYTINSLPFDIPYFGVGVNQITVCTNGYCYMNNPNGYVYGYSPVTLPQASGSTYDGIVKLAMTDGDGRGTTAKLLYWTEGTAPNRRFIITWLNWQHYSMTGSATFQAQFYESGRIQIAYTSGWTWGYTSGVGIDALGTDTRFAAPNNSGSYTFSGTPSNDWRFEPAITSFTGRVMIEEIATGAGGYGSTTRSATPLAGARIDIRTAGGVAGSGITDDNGDFSASGIALNSTGSGSLHLISGSVAATVTSSSSNADRSLMSAPYSIAIANNISFGGDNDVGTYTLNDATDSDGSMRAAVQIAQTIDSLRVATSAFSNATIDPVDVFFSPSSASPSRFIPKTPTAYASIRIAGDAAANPDAFDPSVIARLYMRHLLHAITGTASANYTAGFDVVQADTLAAFADGVGLMAHAALTGERVVYDGLSSNTVDSLDLETPTLTRSPGPSVAGWVGAAMYDLLDAANEAHDTVDGTSGNNAERPFKTLAAIQGTASGDSFLDAWINEGYATGGIVTDFIHHGLLPDDANEPNDTRGTAQFLGVAGVRSTKLTLNRYNEDWYQVTVDQAAPVFFVEVAYDRGAIDAQVTLQAFNGNGTLLGSGSPSGAFGPIVATVTNVPAGPLYIRVAHNGGSKISSYDLQAYAQMSVALASAPAWTVGRRIQEPLDLRGGIPPYTILAKDATGSLFTQIQFLPSQTTAPFDLIWTPQEVGTVNVQVVATDSGTPTHSRTLNLAFVVNAELAFSAPELTGVALNKAADVNLGRTGGTDPIVLSDEFGDLPGGLNVDEDFHIRGTASEPGGGAFGFHATDVAGSESSVDSFLVVCVPIDRAKQPVPLAAGQAAAGFYFDAVSGSVCSMNLKTSKKQTKRELNFLVIGPDGNVVQGGTAKIKAGKVTLKNLGLPTTGRYFMAFASDDGGDASELQGTLKLALPKKGNETLERMALDELYKIEFGALEGAVLNVKGATTEGMEIRVVFIIRPSGEVIPFKDVHVENVKGKVSITTEPLTESGTYQIYLAPLKTDLADFKFKYVIKQPKGAVFSLDD